MNKLPPLTAVALTLSISLSGMVHAQSTQAASGKLVEVSQTDPPDNDMTQAMPADAPLAAPLATPVKPVKVAASAIPAIDSPGLSQASLAAEPLDDLSQPIAGVEELPATLDKAVRPIKSVKSVKANASASPAISPVKLTKPAPADPLGDLATARAAAAQADLAKTTSADPLGELATARSAAAPSEPAKARAAMPLGDLAKVSSADPLGDLAKSVERATTEAVPAKPAKAMRGDPLGDLAKSVSRPAPVALPATPFMDPSADPLGDLARKRETDALNDLPKLR